MPSVRKGAAGSVHFEHVTPGWKVKSSRSHSYHVLRAKVTWAIPSRFDGPVIAASAEIRIVFLLTTWHLAPPANLNSEQSRGDPNSIGAMLVQALGP